MLPKHGDLFCGLAAVRKNTVSNLLTFKGVASELEVSTSHLNYVLNRDGITAAKRSGRGRGGGRMFTRGQLKDIKSSLLRTRLYIPRVW
jgi:hypothetical protein